MNGTQPRFWLNLNWLRQEEPCDPFTILARIRGLNAATTELLRTMLGASTQ